MSEHTPLLTIFPECTALASFAGGLEKSYVTDVQIAAAEKTMTISAWFSSMPSPAELTRLSEVINGSFGLKNVSFAPDYPNTVTAAPQSSGSGVLFGREIKQKPMPMKGVTAESGRVTIEGDVVAVTSRILPKGGGVLCFDITDRTNSVRVSRYFPPEEDKGVISRIEPGDHLTVYGDMRFSNHDDDVILNPRSIVKSKKVIRTDDAPEKRVELHLHTRFSTLDALTDPKAVVKRAAYWGMPAIAVTDHGVAQAFPDMWQAGKKEGVKIIYGMEAYYFNDMDGNSAVIGKSSLPLDAEFIAFDIETTGLNALNDRMTEIGAVLFSGGNVIKEFNTFVDPKMHIPPDITRLTGIRDSDVAGAPDEKTAMEMFMEFAGDRPLIAHNAHFDVGFMTAAANRQGLRFDPVFMDTLALSQALLPELKRFKLDIVSNHLGLPQFNHHRASDDAMVVARIMDKFLPMLKAQGAKTVDDIEKIYHSLRRTDIAKTYHMILLVKNRKGLKNLYEMISQSYLKYYHRTPNIPKSLLIQHREGILVGSACGMGELYGAVMKGASQRELEKIAALYDYLEIQPICNNAFLIDNGTVRDEKVLQDYNRTILELGRKLGKPVIAASDVHFMDAEDEQYRRILQAAKKFSDADRSCPIFFRTTDEMLKEFMYLGEKTAREVVITNTRAIADQVEEIELLPKELFPPKIENSAEQLKELVYSKMHRIYGETPPEIVQQRVDVELNTILDHHYDVIYMSAQKLVQNSLENGYLVGSRGSVGSSIVAYMSGITEVNSLPPHYVCPKCCHSEFILDGSYGCGADMPDKACPVCGEKMMKDGFDIPFETFLGYGGGKVPDIDLNFSGEYQARAHRHAVEMFGETQVFRAGTIGTLAEKTAYGFVRKYLEERDITAGNAEMNRLTLGCVGVRRTTGQHPGGLVVVPDDMDVEDFTAVQHPADAEDAETITTHFEYHCMEDNLLKLDMLGHDDPTMVRMLQDLTGVDPHDIPLDDKDTMSIFTSSKVLGYENDEILGPTGAVAIPEFNTRFTRQMLVDTQPTDFNTLLRLSGFSHGTDVWLGNAKDLILSGTASVLQTVGCRDDIMLYLISMGLEPKMSFKIMEAVRKGKVKKGGFQEGWVEAMEEHQVPQWYIDSLAKIGYLFPKAHAVAYVMMAFRIAWYKVHRPLAFYATFFSIRAKAFDAEFCCAGKEAVKKKIKEIENNKDATAVEQDLMTTLEVCYEFYLRGFQFETINIYESDATRFKVTENGLLPPFTSVRGLGETAAIDTVEKRQGKEFISIEEFSLCCNKLSKTHIEQLKKLGAFAGMADTSQITLF